MSLPLDPRFTFDAFVVGPANRLAVAAARRVAESPGSSYNPLVLYGGSGLGKTHLLSAIGHQVQRVHDALVRYETLEHVIEEVAAAVEAGERDALRSRLREVDVLLVDDVQFLEGQHQVQEELIRVWDALSGQGGQVVLTSDRSPQEIDDLDDRLLSRLSGGLLVDVAAPDFETRVAIVRRKADERGHSLSPEIYRTLARIAFSNVRELQGALNRLLAVQELEGRPVDAAEVGRLLGVAVAERERDEFGEFLSDITGTVSSVMGSGEQRIADAILRWEAEGYRTRRLEAALDEAITAGEADALVQQFDRDVRRLRDIEDELQAMGAADREQRAGVLLDPDRVPEAEGLLARARERRRPPPAPPGAVTLESLEGDSLALKAAAAVVDAPGRTYNPLFVLGPPGSGRTTLLSAIGTGIRERHGGAVAYMDAESLGSELIKALEQSQLDVWRERLRASRALLVDDLDRIAEAERAHEELFHLFDDLYRQGRQLVFAAALPPQELPLPARLRSRLESGLVVELEERAPAGGPEDPQSDQAAPGLAAGAEILEGVEGSSSPATPSEPIAPAAPFLNREKVLWEWPYPDHWIQESLD